MYAQGHMDGTWMAHGKDISTHQRLVLRAVRGGLTHVDAVRLRVGKLHMLAVLAVVLELARLLVLPEGNSITGELRIGVFVGPGILAGDMLAVVAGVIELARLLVLPGGGRRNEWAWP